MLLYHDTRVLVYLNTLCHKTLSLSNKNSFSISVIIIHIQELEQNTEITREKDFNWREGKRIIE